MGDVMLRRVPDGWVWQGAETLSGQPDCPQCGMRMTSALVLDGDTLDDYVSGWACWMCDENDD